MYRTIAIAVTGALMDSIPIMRAKATDTCILSWRLTSTIEPSTPKKQSITSE